LEVHMSRSPQSDDERAVEVRLRLLQAEAGLLSPYPVRLIRLGETV
jgi:hypothetical protein